MKSTPAQFFKNTILVHEGAKHSVDPDDKGNWLEGRLVGSKYGVTGAALAECRKVPYSAITKDVMSKLTEQEAIDLGLAGYYRVRGIDLLPWDEVIAGVVDLGYNAGAKRGVEVLQRLIKTDVDGNAGSDTRTAYRDWRCQLTAEEAMKRWTAARIAYYVSLKNPKYIKGWTNRANAFLPGTAWWKANA